MPKRKVIGILSSIDITESKAGKLIRVSYDGKDYFASKEVTAKQKDVHKQLELIIKSLQENVSTEMRTILSDEAKILRDRLIDLREVKNCFSKNK